MYVISYLDKWDWSMKLISAIAWVIPFANFEKWGQKQTIYKFRNYNEIYQRKGPSKINQFISSKRIT